MTITRLKAKTATFETVSGDARVDGCECGGAQSSSVSGDVAYTGTLAKGGRYTFTSHSGDVVLVTPSGFELNAATFSGDLRVEGLTGEGDSDRRGPGRSRRGRRLRRRGRQAKTFSGYLRFNARAEPVVRSFVSAQSLR